ncbi:hypothetical protein [Magnetovibrio sp.]|uniref:hypothetical protein n=1 Tax=Magnetovibrio sp. TaxID=2024836 RepID=UPI002F95A6F9
MAFRVGIRMKTTSPISELEKILETRCQGEWDVELDTVNAKQRQKTVAIYFETHRDRDAFLSACAL